MSKDNRHSSWIKAEQLIASHISKWIAEGRQISNITTWEDYKKQSPAATGQKKIS